MPDVNGMSLSQIKELKTHISKIVKVLDSERKRNYQDSREVILIDGERYEIKRSIFEYKNYLKYLKGMLNLESISVDLDKYMKIYDVLNERDPLMMSFISKELLKNLTINIKVPTEMEKEGIVNEDTAWQPQ